MSFKPHLGITNWLEKLNLSFYHEFFKEYNGVEDILWMSERDLKNIGIKNGSHRARLITSLTALKEKYEKVTKENQENFIGSPENTLKFNKGVNSPTSISPLKYGVADSPHSGFRSWPSSNSSSLQNTRQSSPRLSMESIMVTEASPEELKRVLERELSLDSSDLRSYAWYHGTILRQRAEELVTCDGDFIVRDCISQPGDFVITCKWNGQPLHFIINKVILQPDTLYERIQYCFENESFDSIPDFIRYYVGSKCPLSTKSGVIISRPITRTMPLTYYATRYGVQCQMHYAVKALEKIPNPSSPNENSPLKLTKSSPDGSPLQSKSIFSNMSVVREDNFPQENSSNISLLTPQNITALSNHHPHLTRVGSDPMLSPNMERKQLKNRPNSGTFSTETTKEIASKMESDKPPPKPSRVPSRKCVQKPLVIKREPRFSVNDVDEDEDDDFTELPTSLLILSHPNSVKRLVSETRFSFLDRPSVSDDGSLPDNDMLENPFTIPSLSSNSIFDPQNFTSPLIKNENTPLESHVLSNVWHILLSENTKTLACHLTRMDLDIAKHYQDNDLGLGITSGLELLFLPQGQQLQKDLLERSESMKHFVATTILTCLDANQRVELINQWIKIALETRTSLGNLYGFTSIMLGLTMEEVSDLPSTWLLLRRLYTENAFTFETKLRPALKALQKASSLEAPNTCIPYLLTLLLILQQHYTVMENIQTEVNDPSINESILSFNIPGEQNADDYGLQLLEDHLEIGRNIMQQFPILKKNGEISLKNVKYDDILLDIFNTEFHLKLLWGSRGAIVAAEERYKKFNKILCLLQQRCNQ